MVIQYAFSGFFIKLITGLDDAMVHIPVVGSLAKTRSGRIAFACGIFLAIILAIIISVIFSQIIRSFPYYHIISSGLIIILAGSIYYNSFLVKPREKIEKALSSPKTKKVLQKKNISLKRFLHLLGLGFLTAFATVIDDTIAYSSLFLSGDFQRIIFAVGGILTATVLQLIVIVKFSKQVNKVPHKQKITIVALLILSLLIYLQIL